MACEISKLVEQLGAKAEKGLVNGLPLDAAVIRLKAAYGKQQVAKVTKKADKAAARAQEKYEAALGTKIERTGTAVKEEASNNSTFEVSIKGDSLGKKFSALNAKLKDGRTIEQAWAEARGYKTIEEAKGKSAKVKGFKYKEVYFGLWEQWAEENPDLVKELAEKTEGMTLVDSFAKTENNQANALTQIVENYRKGEGVTSENGMLKVQTFDKAKPVMVFADGKTSKVFNSIDELTDFAFEYNSIMDKAGKIAVPQDQRMVGQIFSMLKNANIPFKPIRVELAKGKDEAGAERGLYEVKGHRITMYYNNKYTGANPAQVLLHEYVHAITLDHLDKNIELKKKVRALMDHVAKENADLTTWYAMKDEKEFLAEAIAEPKFREALAAIRPMNKRSVLQYVKDLFEELLNSLTNANIKETNAFTEALELVIEVAETQAGKIIKSKDVAQVGDQIGDQKTEPENKHSALTLEEWVDFYKGDGTDAYISSDGKLVFKDQWTGSPDPEKAYKERPAGKNLTDVIEVGIDYIIGPYLASVEEFNAKRLHKVKLEEALTFPKFKAEFSTEQVKLLQKLEAEMLQNNSKMKVADVSSLFRYILNGAQLRNRTAMSDTMKSFIDSYGDLGERLKRTFEEIPFYLDIVPTKGKVQIDNAIIEPIVKCGV